MTGLHITITAAPQGDFTGLMVNENPLLKVGLLYADKVKLSSFSSALLKDFSRMYVYNDQEKIQFIKESLQYVVKDQEELMKINSRCDYTLYLLGRKKLTPKQKVEIKQLQKGLNIHWSNLKGVLEKLVVSSGMENLLPFVLEGVLELEEFAPKDNSLDSLMEDWLNKIDTTLENPKTYPLFDKTINSLVGHAQKVVQSMGVNTSNHIRERTSHVGFVSDVYKRLPSFEEAGFDELLDIRKELQKPLNKFRAAMLDYSKDMDSVPWEEEFEYEAQKLYLENIVPAVDEVEEAFKGNKAISKIAYGALDKAPLGALGFGITSVGDLTELAKIMCTVPVAKGAIDGYKQWKEENNRVRNMKMYYYNAVNKRLK